MIDKILNTDSFAKSLNKLTSNGEVKSLAVAVSGGADSLALVLLSADFCKANNINITAITIDHNLRKESANEAKLVKKWLSERNINHQIIRYEGKIPTSNIQEEARNIRYDLLTDFCKKNNINQLLTGHHLDDNIETFLMRIARGSGIDGLAAIPEKSLINDIQILRPLLTFTRNSIENYLQKIKQEWIIDPSNDKDIYERNRLRKVISSQLDDDIFKRRISTVIENINRTKNALEHYTELEKQRIVTKNPAGYFTINRHEFIKLEEEIAFRILTQLLSSINGKDKNPRFDKLKNLYKNICANSLNISTLAGCIIELNINDEIYIYRELNAINSSIKITSEQNEYIYDNRFSLKLESITANSLVITSLNEVGYLDVKKHFPKIAQTNIPKNILYTLPAIKKITSEGVEIVINIPHINYNNADYNYACKTTCKALF